MKKVIAPFSSEQVKAINAYQHCGWVHGFTCGSPEGIEECTRSLNRENNGAMSDVDTNGTLIATKNGLVCPCGKYKQNWVHEAMTQELPPNPLSDILNGIIL